MIYLLFLNSCCIHPAKDTRSAAQQVGIAYILFSSIRYSVSFSVNVIHLWSFEKGLRLSAWFAFLVLGREELTAWTEWEHSWLHEDMSHTAFGPTASSVCLLLETLLWSGQHCQNAPWQVGLMAFIESYCKWWAFLQSTLNFCHFLSLQLIYCCH